MEWNSVRFLEVHRKDDGKRIAINPKHIVTITEFADNSCEITTDVPFSTKLHYENETDINTLCYDEIQESYEQVIDLINQLKPL